MRVSLTLLLTIALTYELVAAGEEGAIPNADDVVMEATVPLEDLVEVTAADHSETQVVSGGGQPLSGIKTWYGAKGGSWGSFSVGNLDRKPPAADPTNPGGLDRAPFRSKWCTAKGDGKCAGDWTQIALDSKEHIKGVVIQGWGDSCVTKFKASYADVPTAKFTPVDSGADFTSDACSGDTKKTVLFKKPIHAKLLKLTLGEGKGSCCLRWSALVMDAKAEANRCKPYKCYVHGGNNMPMYSAEGCKAVAADAKFMGAQKKYDSCYGECLKVKGGSYTWEKRAVCANKPTGPNRAEFFKKSTCSGNGVPGFRLETHCSAGRIGFLFAMDTHLFSQYEAKLKKHACWYNDKSVAGKYITWNRCGMTADKWPDIPGHRRWFLFKDTIKPHASFKGLNFKGKDGLQRVGSYGNIGTSAAHGWQAHGLPNKWGGIICMKTGAW